MDVPETNADKLEAADEDAEGAEVAEAPEEVVEATGNHCEEVEDGAKEDIFRHVPEFSEYSQHIFQ